MPPLLPLSYTAILRTLIISNFDDAVNGFLANFRSLGYIGWYAGVA